MSAIDRTSPLAVAFDRLAVARRLRPRAWWRRPPPFLPDPEHLIRSELFSAERLEQHAESLAAAQPVSAHRRGRGLAARLRDNDRALLAAYRAIAAAIREERVITPAAEWLVDNFHIAEAQIRQVREDLPESFYRELPKLADGPLAGYPRVFGVAWAFVAHTDSRFDPQMLGRFVQAYQRVQPLTIGELWAVAITLRIVLIENLRRAADRIVRGRAARLAADDVADRLLAEGRTPHQSVEAILGRASHSAMSSAFAVQLVQRLRDQDPAVTPALRWLDERLAAQGTTADEIVHEEHQKQGAMNVTVRNVITSMRLMSAVDWAEFFEGLSLVDATLAAGSDFAAMDFDTRDDYRHAIEALARGSGQSEIEIAQLACAGANGSDPGATLIGRGRRRFEAALRFRAPMRERVARAYRATGLGGYVAALGGLTLLLLALLLWLALPSATAAWVLVVLALLALPPVSDAAAALVNRHVTHRVGPQRLPGMELPGGVPERLRTLVVVPMMLTSATAIAEEVERLEVHHLSNPDAELYFALLSDWTDSKFAAMPDDDALLAAAVAGIADLNRRYEPGPAAPRFRLLHRRRVWDASEEKWIGWERKRGKLDELNRLLRGATDTTFLPLAAGASGVPVGVRYVITLDADTRLPRGAARRLVGKMAHPLNAPRLEAGRVVEGYGVLQPRVTPTLPVGREGSWYQRTFSGPAGMDPYAAAISDVYQDLLGEGSFTGKGIYDVDAFSAALADRVPEDSLLSHDLFEGTFARAGLATDIEVVEEFPARYDVAAARQHRWARGDWQLLPWLLAWRRTRAGAPADRAVPRLGRWKMFDNLRRTVVAPATVLALVAGWTLVPDAAARWTVALLTLLAVPALLPVLSGILPRRAGISKRSHILSVAADLHLAASQTAYTVTMLAHQAWLMTDAVVRTLFRLYVSRRGLLEWFTAAQAKFSLPLTVSGFYRRMAGGVLLALVIAALVSAVDLRSALIAAPLLLLWMASPVVAQWSSRAPSVAAVPLAAADARALQLTARRTWHFFETVVTDADHQLPPDNLQEDPVRVVAHRTSPTNVGLYLLAVVAARDFGWIGTRGLVERLEATLATLSGLERFNGHFYNWYDTRELRALDPKYVSSVDSGNLAAHLLAVANACREIVRAPLIDPAWSSGIADAVALAQESLHALPGERRPQPVTSKGLAAALEAFATALQAEVPRTSELGAHLRQLALHADTVEDMAQALSQERGDGADNQVLSWVRAAQQALRAQRDAVAQLLPWAVDAASAVDAELAELLDSAPAPALADLTDHCDAVAEVLRRRPSAAADHATLLAGLERAVLAGRELERRLAGVAQQARGLFDAMQFGFLLDPTRQLLSIGYQVVGGTLDPNCYDLLASEARLASFIAIAKGDVPARHWFRLGRSLTPVGRGSALISWSGSMFEYLMPSLVLRAPSGSLLEQTSELVVRRQIQYGATLGVPWGISESAYNVRDVELTYQYSNFGVPGLGLKRGLSQDAVIAPYATGLATMVDAPAAARNFARLTAAGAGGEFGYYEALDYTPARIPEGESVAVVRAYMAHHQGMTLVAIANTLHGARMRARFHAEPMVQATELLLQERTPRDVSVARPRAEEVKAAAQVREVIPSLQRRFDSPHDPLPPTHLLSNGRYAVMVTAAGSGYSRWHDLAVTRWREDVSADAWGSYVFLRDVDSGAVWSAGYQPTRVEPDSYEVDFAEDRAEIVRRDGTISTTLGVAVSPEHDAEVRRVSITNLGTRTREIELTSYAEVVLAPAAADAAHPAFAKLFVQTEFVEDIGALLATRRKRSPDEPDAWAVHMAVLEGVAVGALQYETDRARFLGRGREIGAPLALHDQRALSGSVGCVLDPIFSLRRRVSIAPGSTARVAFWTLIAPSRAEALDLADKHQDAMAYERAVTRAWTQAQVQLHHLGIEPAEAYFFQALANRVLYTDPTLRPSPAVLRLSQQGPSTLWPHGISGDLPIVLVRIDEVEDLEIVRQLLRAHEYWRLKQLAVDLVVMNERSSSYTQELQLAVEALVRSSQSRPQSGAGARGNVYALRADLVTLEVRNLLRSVARAVLIGWRGGLAEQLKRLEQYDLAHAAQRSGGRRTLSPAAAKGRRAELAEPASPSPSSAGLEFFNGLGGFANDGREYVTILGEGQVTPAPWINVVANPGFGFQVSVEGGGYTWAGNSRENQLTPWSNDPVGDRPGDVLYVRDEDSGQLWGPTASPIREEASSYVCRHGQGYSRFEHHAHGIGLELLEYVPLDDAVKIARLRIRNRSPRMRRLSVTAYVEWVLGTARGASAPFIVTELDADSGAILARNPWRNEFGERIAFAALSGCTSYTGDRTEFLGRNGTLARPAALLGGLALSNQVGAGFDPCAALQRRIELKPEAEIELVFLLGEAATAAEARLLVQRHGPADLDRILQRVTRYWDDALGTLQVRTPDRAMDVMLNRWLLYQTVACRLWARSAAYQASGAFGFRDQLQDVMALTTALPDLVRAQLLRAAARQFPAGDVQHWWLPRLGQGVRTQISDDRLWLPYVVTHYVERSGDATVLDELLPFLEGPALRDDQADAFFQPLVSDERASVYEHCARAIDCSLALGAHGLPLIGSGDWNDGMNRVGAAGRGESVWLGWFLHAVIDRFAPVADRRGETERAATWRAHARQLAQALESAGWDGSWYRRGYFDDGTPLGSSASDECQIDAIAQSWAVISGVAPAVHAAQATAAVASQLVQRRERLIMLFTPPFDQTPHDPGYIKGYPPGVRENGGQYTHAAVWSVIAAAMLGDGDGAAELFGFLNPIRHADTRTAMQRYKVEPYVVCADVYSHPPHVGRGGWTWYTGSAGWLYRAGVEAILGLQLRGEVLHVEPCVPRGWPGFALTLRHRSARYDIAVENPAGVSRGVCALELDGAAVVVSDGIALRDDGGTHRVRVVLG
jgi:cyclic beta-1,2-glucan synthetase